MRDRIVARMGHNLCQIRRKAGLDIDGVACRTGLQPADLGRYEAGRERIPVDVLAQLARTFNRPISDFFV